MSPEMINPPGGTMQPDSLKDLHYIVLDDKASTVHVGGRPVLGPGKNGRIYVGDEQAEQVVEIDATPGADNVLVRFATQRRVFAVNNNAWGDACGVFIGAPEADGGKRHGVLILRDVQGYDAVFVSAASGQDNLLVNDKDRKRVFAVNNSAGDACGVYIGAPQSDGGGGRHGVLVVRDKNGADSVVIDGAAGDIILANADCAEDFDVVDHEDLVAGAVMVIEDDGRLRQCSEAYDRRVAGVVAGGGALRPGLVLDRQPFRPGRTPISLVGKVFCRVDARPASIGVGDLLTTAELRGHAMKATDHAAAFGSVLGKALAPQCGGIGMIPILVALQ
jgi:hypothetical protein